MKIYLSDKFKSLRRFESEELEKLTIITGRNGSGKSQLLDLIEKKSKNDTSVASIRLEIVPHISRIQSEGIIKETSTQIGHEQWKSIVKINLDNFNSLTNSSKALIKYIIENNFQLQVYDKSRRTLISVDDDYKVLIAKVNAEKNNTAVIETRNVDWNIERRALRNIFNPKNEGLFRFITEICSYTGKKETELTDADFYNTPIKELLIDEDSLFSSQVELIFYNYAKRRDLNRKDWFYKNNDGEENNSISDTDFVSLNLPPWVIINDILTKHNIDFYFKGIEKKEFNIDVPLDFKLFKKSTDEIIPFIDLSSGEKVIIGLILKLFTSEYYGENLNFPELLVLDEPDSHLHPEMSKLLLDVLDKTFVNKFGISVILTTHSPSTIALANENSIFQLTNGNNTSLMKISKDDALQILTSFIPTLSIDYKNHKQIFVESPTDRYYYQTIFDRLNQENNYPFKLYFISNGYGKGNSNQVVDIVEAIRKSENKTCFGVIDWDKKNSEREYIKVHGINSRYSIENYVYDPIYLIVLLLEMNAHGIYEALGIDLSFNEYSIGNNVQLINSSIDWFFKFYYSKYTIPEEQQNLKRKVCYQNQIEVEIPIWYLEFQGHDLETKLKEVFIALQKFRNEGELQKKLSIISAKCYPLIHKDTVELIDRIINVG